MRLKVDGVSICLGNKIVIEQAGLSCQPGQFIALCGANGAGKSTLLKAIAGEIPYVSGSISINGDEVSTLNHAEMALRRAVMPQQVDITFNFTAFDIIAMGLLFVKTQDEKNRIIQQVSHLFDLQGLLQQSYLQLSGGQQQRVQLGRVVAQILQENCDRQRYLFLDECSSAMDMAIVHQAFSALTTLTDLGIGIIAVMHDLNIASLYADEIIMLKNRTTAFSGTPKEVINEQNILDVFDAKVQIISHPSQQHPVVIQSRA